ncbi:unnamed protein product [Linum tenue]|uniref:Myb-like domain-containing protein n=1 Tax=Linum tenue TaxID=586396 RepID=A0AAV0JSJ1_9ROSI|nr:unnamed protein product [Linum tenue]
MTRRKSFMCEHKNVSWPTSQQTKQAAIPFPQGGKKNQAMGRESRSKAGKGRSSTSSASQEVSSREWEVVRMNEQEEDLISRMYRLVGQRWDLIAGRIPGRTAEEIERFWIMKNRGWASAERNV